MFIPDVDYTGREFEACMHGLHVLLLWRDNHIVHWWLTGDQIHTSLDAPTHALVRSIWFVLGPYPWEDNP